jgi:hypothetical protein
MLQWLKSLPGKISDSWEKLMEARQNRAEKVALAKDRWLYRQIDRVVNYKTVIAALLIGVLAHAALPLVLGPLFAAYVLKGIVTEALVRNQKAPPAEAERRAVGQQPAPNLVTEIVNQITQALAPLVNALAPLVPGVAQANVLNVPAPQAARPPARPLPPIPGVPAQPAVPKLTEAERGLKDECLRLAKIQQRNVPLREVEAQQLALRLRVLNDGLNAAGVRRDLVLGRHGGDIAALITRVKQTLQPAVQQNVNLPRNQGHDLGIGG